MAKAKKTNGVAKGAKAITDIAHPGTSAPPDTSKPIIRPRPIIKDPMMVGADGMEAPKDEPEKPSIKRAGETRIAPLDAKTDTGPETGEDPEPKAGPEAKPDAGPGAGVEAEAGAAEEEQDDKAGKPDDKTDEEPDGKPALKTDGNTAKADKANKTDDKPDDEADGKTDAAVKDESKADAATAEAEKDEAEAEQDAQLQKLIDTKKYFLPINAVEQRRSARFVAVGVILALILAAAWVDIALDAGLIHLGSVKPVTHLFSN